METPYYITFSDPLCYYCGSEHDLTSTPETYPICVGCKEQGSAAKNSLQNPSNFLEVHQYSNRISIVANIATKISVYIGKFLYWCTLKYNVHAAWIWMWDWT